MNVTADGGLLALEALTASPVVANCRMNRERNLLGYVQELGCDPLAHLVAQPRTQTVAWLDVCCGSGRALIEAVAKAPRDVRARPSPRGRQARRHRQIGRLSDSRRGHGGHCRPRRIQVRGRSLCKACSCKVAARKWYSIRCSALPPIPQVRQQASYLSPKSPRCCRYETYMRQQLSCLSLKSPCSCRPP